MIPTNVVPNLAFGNAWKVTFSNFPIIQAYPKDQIDFSLLEYFIKDIQVPDFGVEVIVSSHYRKQQETPTQPSNTHLMPFVIKFGVSEGFENYKLFHNWLNGIRYGHQFKNSLNKINNIELKLLDNQKRETGNILLFTNIYVSNITGFTLTSGEGSELEFSVTFNQQEVTFTTA